MDPKLPVLLSTDDEYRSAFEGKYAPGRPSFFPLRGPLPVVGRTDTVLAATENLTAILKCYAESGENTLHAHTSEDHVFVVLQGEANFQGPNGEVRTIGPMHGVMLPRGTFYSFKASAGEPLVMLRVGGAAAQGGNMFDRVGIDGQPMAGNAKENKHVDPVLRGDFFEPLTKAPVISATTE